MGHGQQTGFVHEMSGSRKRRWSREEDQRWPSTELTKKQHRFVLTFFWVWQAECHLALIPTLKGRQNSDLEASLVYIVAGESETLFPKTTTTKEGAGVCSECHPRLGSPLWWSALWPSSSGCSPMRPGIFYIGHQRVRTNPGVQDS